MLMRLIYFVCAALGDLSSNVSIDLTKHHVPKNFLDKVAYRTVKLLRIPTDLFFKVRKLQYLAQF